MDPAASAAAAPAAGSGLKKQPKVRKDAKDLMLDDWRKESEKHAGQRVAVQNLQKRPDSTRSTGERPSGSSPLKPWPTARSQRGRPPCAPS
jgi:hypothetical protein